MNGEVWVENLGQRAKITLGRGETGDFVFTSLQMGENWFTCSENPLEFAQWVYLVSPVAFRMTLEGTKYDPSTKFVVCQTAKVTGSQPVLRFEWELTVQYLLCSCDGGGVETEIRQFPLVFIQKSAKKSVKSVAGVHHEVGSARNVCRSDLLYDLSDRRGGQSP
jgi:hypothetical protein